MDKKELIRSLRQAQDCLADADERGLEVDIEFTHDFGCIQGHIQKDLEPKDERRFQVDRAFTDWSYCPDSDPVTEDSSIVQRLWSLLS